MFLMAFHRPVCGWLGVIHLDEAGKELQGVGAEISDPWRAGEASRSSALRRSAATPAGGSETPIMVSRRLSSSGSTMVGTGCGWGRMDGHGETRNPILSGGGPASPFPSTRLGERRRREYRGRGCKPVCMPDF